jgi:photosystem II stability/assembly factor-like uncharacterized protein
VDGGINWETYVVAGQFLTLAVSPTNGETVYGGDIGLGMFRSSDHGKTWTPINNGINAIVVYDVQTDPKDSTHMLAGTISGVYEKKEGKEWSRILTNSARSLEFHPQDSQTIFAGLEHYVAKTTNGGLQWSYSMVSDETQFIYDICISATDPESLYLAVDSYGGGGAIFKSENGGDSFTRVLLGENSTGQSYSFNTVTIDPSNALHILAGGGNFYAPKVYGDLWESTDAGATWTRNSLSTLDVIVNDLLIDPSNPLILYAGCGYSGGLDVPVYKSTDAGVTWKEFFNGIPEVAWNAVTDLAFHRLNTDVVYASTNGAGIYISPNQAKNWLNLKAPDYDVYALATGSLYAATQGGLHQCTGTGVIAGQLMDNATGASIDQATVFNDLGVKTISIDGEYMMVTPVGIFSITAAKSGYENKTVINVEVYGGDVSWVDMSMKAGVSDQAVIPPDTSDTSDQVVIPGGVLYPSLTGANGGGDIGGGGCFISTIADGSR